MTSLPAAVREQVESYERRTRWLWAQTFEVRGRALLSEQSLKGTPLVIALIFAILSLIFFGITLWDGDETEVALSALCLFVFLVSSIIAGLLMRRIPSAPSVLLTLNSGFGACFECGAPVSFEEGAGSARCRYCGFSSIVDDDIKLEMKLSAVRRLNLEVSERDLLLKDYDANLNRRSWFIMVAFAIGIAIFGWAGRALVARFPQTEPKGWLIPACLLIIAGLARWSQLGLRFRAREAREYDAFIAALKGGEG